VAPEEQIPPAHLLLVLLHLHSWTWSGLHQQTKVHARAPLLPGNVAGAYWLIKWAGIYFWSWQTSSTRLARATMKAASTPGLMVT
jgi:hypothetical protein